MSGIWTDDLLEYSKVGDTFTNLIKTLDENRVISIEAGFGRGKTFFRKAWAQQLRGTGEVVVEIDAQKSDHSGDPLITVLAALVESLPRKEKGKGAKALGVAKKFGAIGGRAAARIALRSGAEELIDTMSEKAIDQLGDFDALDQVITDIGDGMSKAAGQMIAAQMAAERVRKEELPDQLKALQAALTEKADTDRVVIIIDELDRCHPNYAIAVLEAMKLVFGQSGFVFCLMVNAEYLEKLAEHQFGISSDDERYLDKFVDIRLRLQPRAVSMNAAVTSLAMSLPLGIPFGESEEFSIAKAAELAGKLAVSTNFSMRKIKRILLQVELAMRCYSKQPLDASLLVFLAFEMALNEPLSADFLPRSQITPRLGRDEIRKIDAAQSRSSQHRYNASEQANALANKLAPELINLPRERYEYPDEKEYFYWASLFKYMAPKYLPMHRDALGAVAELLAE